MYFDTTTQVWLTADQCLQAESRKPMPQFHRLVMEGNLLAVQATLDMAGDTGRHALVTSMGPMGWTPLHLACIAHGMAALRPGLCARLNELADLLLAHGADLHALDKFGRTPNCAGEGLAPKCVRDEERRRMKENPEPDFDTVFVEDDDGEVEVLQAIHRGTNNNRFYAKRLIKRRESKKSWAAKA